MYDGQKKKKNISFILILVLLVRNCKNTTFFVFVCPFSFGVLFSLHHCCLFLLCLLFISFT